MYQPTEAGGQEGPLSCCLALTDCCSLHHPAALLAAAKTSHTNLAIAEYHGHAIHTMAIARPTCLSVHQPAARHDDQCFPRSRSSSGSGSSSRKRRGMSTSRSGSRAFD